jgi:hypothetical protein
VSPVCRSPAYPITSPSPFGRSIGGEVTEGNRQGDDVDRGRMNKAKKSAHPALPLRGKWVKRETRRLQPERPTVIPGFSLTDSLK